MIWPDRVSKILNIKYPVIQAPMLGVTTPEMVAAVSNNGGLGSLPVGGLSAEKTLALIQRTKELTDKPFAVNLFAHPIPAVVDENEFNAMQDFLSQLCTTDGIQVEQQAVDKLRFYSYKDLISTLISENIKVVSFTFGVPDDESIEILKANQAILIGTATSAEEAQVLDEKGIDMITMQGIEAGGHRGSFLDMDNPPLIGLRDLMHDVTAITDKPLIAAGAIADGKSVHNAFNLGADAVQVGSIFIASHESLANENWKKAVQEATDDDIVLTKAYSGRWARGVKNKLIESVENSALDIPTYPYQNALTAPIRVQAKQQNNIDYIAMWRGQSSVKIQSKSAAEIFLDLVSQAEKTI